MPGSVSCGGFVSDVVVRFHAVLVALRARRRSRRRASPRPRRPPRPAWRRSPGRASVVAVARRACTRAIWTTLPSSRRRRSPSARAPCRAGRARRWRSRRSRSTASERRAVERGEDRLCVVAVGGVRRRHGVGGDGHRVSGRAVDGRRVGATVAARRRRRCRSRSGRSARRAGGPLSSATSSTCISTRVPVRVGDVVGVDPVLAALGRAVTSHAMPPASCTPRRCRSCRASAGR